jgi:hypothetical protein
VLFVKNKILPVLHGCRQFVLRNVRLGPINGRNPYFFLLTFQNENKKKFNDKLKEKDDRQVVMAFMIGAVHLLQKKLQLETKARAGVNL